MTVIVAAITKSNTVVMAADSQTTSGSERLHLNRTKLWIDGQYLIGASGTLRDAQVIQHHVTLPKYRPDEHTDIEQFMVTEVVPAIRKGIDGHGVVRTEAGRECMNTSLLVALIQHIVEISYDYAVCIPATGAHAIGSGYAEARGYLGQNGPWTPQDVINAARRATQSNIGCGGDVVWADSATRNIKIASSTPSL